ncbi:hypothetical protein QRB41_00905 [Mycobacterium avium subsp. hominissuis]|uniref:DUF7391 family protein n=1 Tax=Mycobacterium avium TaxID=1764 RepID=UPI0002FF8B4F|nr:hypothetical protein [Mycobacterium avium]MDO2381975.1 hypothetical protein [Mycobacterium avium subsp. hominissuis]QBC86334.1 hypothetical protein B6K05_017585 [Mycobacterium avium subsp. hominissuis]
MTSPIKSQPKRNAKDANRTAPAATCDQMPPGWKCSLPLGHSGPHAAEPITEPPATDPEHGAAPAASVIDDEHSEDTPYDPPPPAPAAPRRYGFNRRGERDVELPSGGFVRVRQLSTTQVIKLGVLNMRDSFGAELLKNIGGDEEALAAAAESWATDPERNGPVIDTLDRIAAAGIVCPTVVLAGPTTDDQVNVDDIELADKWVIFDAAMPDELKAAAQEAQQAALKSLRRE